MIRREDQNASLPVVLEDLEQGQEDAATRLVRFGVGTLDMDRCQLLDDEGGEIPITAMEFELLKVFATRPNRPLSRDQLLTLTQNREWDPYDRSIDIRIARLRRKIEPNPRQPTYIQTIYGVGYRLRGEE